MGGSVYTPRQRNWRFYTDATPDTSMSALANEIVKAPLQNNTNIIRLRVTIAETGGKGDSSVTIALEYSLDGSTGWTSLGAAAHWNYANGAATEGGTVGTQLLTDATTKNEYCESGTNAVNIGASTTNEIDIAITPTANITANQTYYFRVIGDGTAIALDAGESYPQVQSAQVVSASAAITATATVQTISYYLDCILAMGSAIAGTATVNSVDFQLGHTVEITSAIPCTATVNACEVTISVDYTFAADGAITSTGSVLSADIFSDVMLSPSPNVGTATVNDVGFVIDHVLSQNAIVGSGVPNAPDISSDQVLAMTSAITGSVTIPSVDLETDQTISVDAIAATGTSSDVVVSTDEAGDVTVYPDTIAGAGTMYSVSFEIDQVLAMTLATAIASIPEVGYELDAVLGQDAITALASALEATLQTDQVLAQELLSGTATVAAVEVITDVGITVALAVITASGQMLAIDLNLDATVEVGVITAGGGMATDTMIVDGKPAIHLAGILYTKG